VKRNNISHQYSHISTGLKHSTHLVLRAVPALDLGLAAVHLAAASPRVRAAGGLANPDGSGAC
jgi:hypothetical protein